MPETSPPPAPRRFQAIPVEETTKKVRRFAPEPVETTTRSSKADATKKDAAGRKHALPIPVETSFKSSRLNKSALSNGAPSPTRQSLPPPDTPKPRRRFAPELIETTKRSKRAGDSRPATLPTDKTDITPGVPNIYTARPRPNVPREARDPAGNLIPGHIEPSGPRRQGSMRPHNNTRRSTRQNSFHPQLESIFSEESSPTDNEDSLKDSTPSLTGSLGSSEDSVRIQMARTRESCDDRFSGYLLALAAKAAEKQLQEQALAAFPNESLHEVVEHFYDREVDAVSDEETVEGIGMLLDDPEMPIAIRRKSTEIGWAAKEMQQHQEKLNRLREEDTNKKIAAEATEPTFQDPFWTNGMTSKPFVSKATQIEVEALRSATSPPMLGSDLTFRMCPSPKATKFESDQPIDVQPNRHPDGGGLWGGYCVAEESGEYLSPSIQGPTLIQTPHTEREDPFSSAFSDELSANGAKPSKRGESGIRMLAGIDETLKAEVAKSKAQEALLAEFDDSFVTQVYNYLSLGYPTLARPYDPELSRISGIPEEELRVNDSKTDAKGYIGIGRPEQANGGDRAGYCARWKALRVYIFEWALQHPSMSHGATSPSAWGVIARRGSWAI